jgi:cell division protein FtsI/penicillin-binding protein 2
MSLDAYEPGSVMKPIIISKAIDVGILDANTTINCENGRWAFGGSVLTDHEPYGVLTVAEVIKFSSNIGTAKIGVKLGDKNVYNILKLFGLTSKTGFPDTRKTGASLQNYKKWSKMKVTRVVIGQGVSVTPLQLVRAYCALANKGILPELRLLDRIKHGEKIVKVKPSVKRIVLKHPESAEKITNIMKLVTQEGGTATKAAVDGYYLAGKTGTAQKAINGRYSNSKFCATFVGFIPADNPKFVLLVMADEPHNGHYGGSVAGPTFKAIADETLRYYSIRPDYYMEDEVK